MPKSYTPIIEGNIWDRAHHAFRSSGLRDDLAATAIEALTHRGLYFADGDEERVLYQEDIDRFHNTLDPYMGKQYRKAALRELKRQNLELVKLGPASEQTILAKGKCGSPGCDLDIYKHLSGVWYHTNNTWQGHGARPIEVSAQRAADEWSTVGETSDPGMDVIQEADDAVNHPRHYTSDPSGVECIQVTRHRNFNIGNAIKYLWRAGLKNGTDETPKAKQIEDLQKAVWYINDEIARLEQE